MTRTQGTQQQWLNDNTYKKNSRLEQQLPVYSATMMKIAT